MIVICESCGASLDASAAAENPGPITIKCTQCGHLMTGVELPGHDTAGIYDTQPKRPAFKVPESTIDAPDPDSISDESIGYPDFATAPEDAFKPKSAIKPLDAPLSPPLGTFRPNRKKPPPLPPIGPTGTTAGMIPPSIAPGDEAQTQPVGPVPETGGLSAAELGPLEPGDTEDFPPVGPKQSSPHSSGLDDELETVSVVEAPPETISSIADAVKHLTTGEIPTVTIPASVDEPLDFTDEKPTPPTAPAPKGKAGLSWVLIISLCVNIVLVYLWQTERRPNASSVALASLGSQASLSNVNALIFAAQAIQQDTDEGRKRAQTLLKSLTIPDGSSKIAQSTVDNAKLLLAQISLDRAQNAALQKQSIAAELTQAEEWLNALSPSANTHPLAPGLRARLHRLAGRSDAANTALNNRSVPQTTEPSLAGVLRAGERALLDLPAAEIDASGRVMGLNRLSSDIVMLPTYWGLRVDAALAAKRHDLAEEILLSAPSGMLRAHFRRQIKELRPNQKQASKTKQGLASSTSNKTGSERKSNATQFAEPLVDSKPSAVASEKLRKDTPDRRKKTMNSLEAKPKKSVQSSSTIVKASDTPRSKPVKTSPAKSASEISGESYTALMKQGARLLENGRIRQARAKFEAAAKANSNRPSPFVQLGWCEINLQSYGRAVRQFKKALSVSPNHRDGTFGLGVAYEKMGRTSQAIQVYERYLSRHPNDRNTRKIRFRLDRLKP
ncbi:MAG: hypothetical protein CMH52_00725 [Myxococcales bacterium]|nr:hypothetical protein [Myxococcales bacterium]